MAQADAEHAFVVGQDDGGDGTAIDGGMSKLVGCHCGLICQLNLGVPQQILRRPELFLVTLSTEIVWTDATQSPIHGATEPFVTVEARPE